jgi:molybdate transport system ATP-binding protein
MSTPFFEIAVQTQVSERFSLDLSLSTPAKTIALSGPSGCGKTSLLHIMAGIQPAEQATITVGGKTWQDASCCLSAAERRTGLVLQDALLFPLLDVRENLNFGSHRATGKMTLDSVVSLLEISHLLDRRARNLSGGERQRVALGRALLSEPDLLLLDEPFAPLDAPRRDRLVQMLGDIQAQWQLPIMLISHDPVDIKSLVEQIFLMDDGRIPGSKRLAQTGGRS